MQSTLCNIFLKISSLAPAMVIVKLTPADDNVFNVLFEMAYMHHRQRNGYFGMLDILLGCITFKL